MYREAPEPSLPCQPTNQPTFYLCERQANVESRLAHVLRLAFDAHSLSILCFGQECLAHRLPAPGPLALMSTPPLSRPRLAGSISLDAPGCLEACSLGLAEVVVCLCLRFVNSFHSPTSDAAQSGASVLGVRAALFGSTTSRRDGSRPLLAT
jgi:hypothetical protein